VQETRQYGHHTHEIKSSIFIESSFRVAKEGGGLEQIFEHNFDGGHRFWSAMDATKRLDRLFLTLEQFSLEGLALSSQFALVAFVLTYRTF
jgi:hypothetical protein